MRKAPRVTARAVSTAVCDIPSMLRPSSSVTSSGSHSEMDVEYLIRRYGLLEQQLQFQKNRLPLLSSKGQQDYSSEPAPKAKDSPSTSGNQFFLPRSKINESDTCAFQFSSYVYHAS